MTDTQDWSLGYPVAAPYPPSWHSFESPAHLAVVCALMDVAWEVGPETPLSIADLGCGTGYTATVLAGSNPHWRVLGLDYNPAHVLEARSIAAEAGLANFDCREADLSTLDDAALDALPEFDVVNVHGLWSWVADPVRDGVLRVIRRKLKPGGIAMVSYNALPGAATALGLARLARATMRGAAGADDGKAMLADQVRALVAAEAQHLPPSGWREMLLDASRHQGQAGYLLHEFATEHWRPSFHGDVVAALASARCDYVGSATLDENFPDMTLSAEQQALWRAAPDEAARQLITDLCVPRAFRRDVYMRGLRRLPRGTGARRIKVALTTWTNDPVQLRTQAGVAELPAPIIEAVRTRLRESTASIDELCALPPCQKVTPAELLALLVASGLAVPLWHPAGEDADRTAALAVARRLNAVAVARLAPHGTGAGRKALVSPALGGGLSVDSLELAVAQLVAEGPPDPGTPAELTDRLVPPDTTLPPETRAGLEAAIAALLRDRLPAWRALAIV
jgi:SAM-dependent methyltransferase